MVLDETVLSLSSICHIYTTIYELDRIYSALIPSYNNTANPGFCKKKENNNTIFGMGLGLVTRLWLWKTI